MIEVLRRRSTRFDVPLHGQIDMLHAALGLSTEAGELLDVIKKQLFYGTIPSTVHLKEELGDILWYVALAASQLNTTFDELMDINTQKLRQRYGNTWSSECAESRDTEAEFKVMHESAAQHHPV